MNAPLNVLIVEDEALLALDIQMILEDLGHHVLAEAASLQELRDLSDLAAEPDMAFVDIQLAHGDSGLEACAVILGQWRAAVVVFITANPAKIPNDFAGGHAVIAKPFTRSGLIGAVRYLEEGMRDPPPQLAAPTNFRASAKFAASLAAA